MVGNTMKIDYLNITVPESVAAKVSDEVLEVLDYCGSTQSSAEIHRLGSSGTVKIRRKHGFTLFSFSGSALEVLRDQDQYAALLWVFAMHPHRVTSIDVAHDVRPESPSKIINALYRRAKGPKGIKLTQKRVQPRNVKKLLGPSLYGGEDTGTIYLARRTSEVSLTVYDKRQEILVRTGQDIGYNLLRYELTVTSKMGISLKDVQEPDGVFWNFMYQVLPPPPGYSPGSWVGGGEGFSMPERRRVMPAEKLKQVVGESEALDRWIKYADEAGPNGREYLLGLLRRRILGKDSPVDIEGVDPGPGGDQVDPGE